MALNLKPFYGPNDPFNHPLPTFPDKGIPLRSNTNNNPEFEKKDFLREEALNIKVKKMIADAFKNRLKRLDIF
jgi:hypothetical protein